MNLKKYIDFPKKYMEHDFCLYGWYGNVIRNANCYKILNSGKLKTFVIVRITVIEEWIEEFENNVMREAKYY